ncbi:MAG: phosphoribosylformylglycinamidine synthase subunit PurQ [Candidatus Omnitrophica bacterium]|nr:phosphoribosylformylglycinamidine synthase subunit PurQ [Candidatus Omnitrophota bacterium]
MKFGVVIFPGSNCDQDCVHVLQDVLDQQVVPLWHQETSLKGCDAVVLPGGFSYGDYLRTGAVARFSPIMRAVARFAHDGGLVIGICNGFQILLEAGLLPGAMLRNTGLRFICRFVTLRVERTDSPFTNQFQLGQVVRMPIAHNEGRYTTDEKTRRAIHTQVLFRYCDEEGRVTETANPNGSTDGIAGFSNEAGNVMGLMPHPERAAEEVLGSADGRLIFVSMMQAMSEQQG